MIGKRWFVVAALGIATAAFAATPALRPAQAVELSEDQIRAIATEAAERTATRVAEAIAEAVASEVAARIAAKIAKEIAGDVAEEVAVEVATDVAKEVLADGVVAKEAVDLSPAVLADADNLKAGKKLWRQCRHCHGKAAYPGKAPKLKPHRYKPEFVYDRITFGFNKMPAWKDVFTDEERVQLVAYILSKRFSP